MRDGSVLGVPHLTQTCTSTFKLWPARSAAWAGLAVAFSHVDTAACRRSQGRLV
jgi:hypothetical protein